MITLGNSIKLPRQLSLEVLQMEFEEGNQEALALAIHLCAQRGLLLPPWIMNAWRQGCYDIVNRKVESWDEVLANGKRKTVKKLLSERMKAQKMFMIRHFAYHYREIPISNNPQKLKRVGNRVKEAPDRFGTIAMDLTAAGKARGAFGPCSRSEARTLWYELFPTDAAKTKHKKAQR